ncbi:MAG: Na+/H+ antiporter NhaA [Flavobacteriales bacterium]|jgi:NhaA family Na+:H+ antiporter|nr:MAG: Na+/H+ antiporter NhaA [Flavobacteriales bacterium]
MAYRAPIDRIRQPFDAVLGAQTSGGVLLFIATVVAMVWANSPWAESYHHLWAQHIVVGNETWRLDLSLHHWINDGLMAMFFFVVGLELKREMVAGELSRPRDAMLPLAAALGGMIVPALIYLAQNPSGPAHAGWGIPMATDIAFALGLMALLGNRVPVALKIFLTTLAVADDLGAVLVIALFYTSDISVLNLALGAGILGVMWVGNRYGVRSPWFYAFFGIGGVWTAFLMSGVHATIAGVLAAFVIPAKPKVSEMVFVRTMRRLLYRYERHDPGSKGLRTADQLHELDRMSRLGEYASTPLQQLEHTLHPLVTFVVLPLFALANAGVALPADLAGALGTPVAMGVGLGLLLGKPIGVMLASYLMVRFAGARLGTGVTWRHMIGAGILAGIGFTMSLFVNELAFADEVLRQEAKLGVLCASLLAGILGYVWLVRTPKKEAA